MTPQEMEAQLKNFQSQFDGMKKDFEATKKDFELKLETANREAETWKVNAQKREQELATFKEQSEKLKKEAEQKLAEAKRHEIKAFAEGLKRDGRITPALEEIVIKLAESMTSDAEIMSFKQKDGSTLAHSQLSLFKMLLGSLPKGGAVSFDAYTVARSVTGADTPEGDAPVEQFVEVLSKNGGKKMLPVRGLELDKLAEEYMEKMRAKGTPVSYGDALIAMSPRKVSA